MKKLQLKALDLGAREILSREQLKSINGGCSSDNDCAVTAYCDSSGSCYEAIGSGGSGTGSGGVGGGGSGSPSQTCANFQDSAGNWINNCPCSSGGNFNGCSPSCC